MGGPLTPFIYVGLGHQAGEDRGGPVSSRPEPPWVDERRKPEETGPVRDSPGAGARGAHEASGGRPRPWPQL